MEDKSIIKALQFVESKDDGWYWKAKDTLEYLVQITDRENGSIRGVLSDQTVNTINQIYRVFYEDQERFIEEYLALLPEITAQVDSELIVFSHNDTQENNFLYNKTRNETKIIDFEYSSLNFRGVDLASYLIESSIDYTYEEPPNYKIDAEELVNNFDSHEAVN